MDGAAQRHQHQRSMVWWGAVLPNLKEPLTLDEFLNGKRDRKAEVKKWCEVWDKVDRSLALNRGRN